ncbi:roundabout-like protein 1, partial [Biomphalaria glabrata]
MWSFFNEHVAWTLADLLGQMSSSVIKRLLTHLRCTSRKGSGISVLPEFLESYTNVPMEPVFVNTNSNITVREGGRALLPCSIQHLGTKKVSWRFIEEDKYLTIGTMAWSPDDNISVEHVKHSEEHEDWTLVIPKVKKSHAGLYECQLTSVAGYHTNVRLNVVGPPITIP